MLLFCWLDANAQWNENMINFDTPQADSLLSIDNSASNVWQIGHTTKQFFTNSAQSIAIMTDTLNPYPINNLSEFVINLGNNVGEMTLIMLSFSHSFETDSLRDGGFIELSTDSGATWLSGGFFGIYMNTLGNGTYGFSGTRPWQSDMFYSCPNPNTFGKPIFVKFGFYSDSIPDGNKAGWLIDDMHFSISYCSGIEQYRNDNLINIFPSPATDKIFVKRTQPLTSSLLSITDITARELFNEPFPQNGLVDVSSLPNGVYYMVYSDERHRAVKSFVISR